MRHGEFALSRSPESSSHLDQPLSAPACQFGRLSHVHNAFVTCPLDPQGGILRHSPGSRLCLAFDNLISMPVKSKEQHGARHSGCRPGLDISVPRRPAVEYFQVMRGDI